MSDFESALPVRTEADAHMRLQVKIVDATDPTIQAIVDADGNVHVGTYGNNPAGANIATRLSELGATVVDGVYDVTNNSDPANVGLVAMVRNATPNDTQQTMRLTAIANGATTVRALDVALRDENGEPFTPTNPLPVTFVDAEGLEINSYLTSAAVAGGASVNHDYLTVAAFKFTQVNATGSGRAKIEVQIETGAATNVFTTVAVQFNSTAQPNMAITFNEAVAVISGARVRVIRTNREILSAQDLYSTISGHYPT